MSDERDPLTNADADATEADTRDEGLPEIDDGEFYAVPNVSGNLLWSFISMVLAIASVIVFPFFYIVGIIFAALALVFAVVSSRVLGFFDRMALFGIIFGIFGLVFGLFSMILDLTGILDGIFP